MYPLAVFTPLLGAVSETFIQRHATDLFPDKTVVLYRHLEQPDSWNTNAPKHDIDKIAHDLQSQSVWFMNRVINKLKNPLNAPRAEITLLPPKDSQVKAFLIKHEVKVILGEYLDQSLWLLKIANQLGIKFFAHAHGYDISMQLKKHYISKAYMRYNHSDGIITMSEASKNRLVAIGINPAKISVIPYGIHIDKYNKVWIDKDIIKCIAVGRMVEKKAPLLLLGAFKMATEQCSNLHLDYIGDGELMPDVKRFVNENHLTKNITLHGAKSNNYVKKLMKESDMFLQHSVIDPFTGDEEGMPVAILEAMGYGLPIVSTLHAGIPEAVTHGKDGYLVPEGNIKDMSEFIIKIATNFSLRKQMGSYAFQKVNNHFSWSHEKSKLIEVLGLKSYMR